MGGLYLCPGRLIWWVGVLRRALQILQAIVIAATWCCQMFCCQQDLWWNRLQLTGMSIKLWGWLLQAEGRPKGQAGLGNLGNTCFMNSSLQCLAHAPPLVRVFLSGQFRADLNPDNPLGNRGELAQAFGALLQALWKARALHPVWPGTVGRWGWRESGAALHRREPSTVVHLARAASAADGHALCISRCCRATAQCRVLRLKGISKDGHSWLHARQIVIEGQTWLRAGRREQRGAQGVQGGARALRAAVPGLRAAGQPGAPPATNAVGSPKLLC